MSKRNRRDAARDINRPLTDPSLPVGAHRGIAAQDRPDFRGADYIKVDGEPFAYVMGPGRPGRARVAQPGDPIPSGNPEVTSAQSNPGVTGDDAAPPF